MPEPFFNSLYVHVPFCAAKCAYCAFYSEAGLDGSWHRRWLDRIEIEFHAHASACTPLSSIFIGGGTPTLLAPEDLQRLFDAIHRHFRLAGDCEISIEANPGSLNLEKIAVLAAAGVNRVSLGVQSFSPRWRQILGRLADPAGVPILLDELRAAGIRRLNLDLIYAIPGQTLADWEEDLRRAGDLGISHLSAYALTFEEGTRLAGAGETPADDELQVAMWDKAAEILGSYGLQRYEISNYAKPGAECRHNLDIWLGGTYLGAGPAAASFDGCRRWTNPADLRQWLAGAPPELDEISAEARAAEILAFGLRTTAGWDLETFRQKTGFSATTLRGETIADLCRQELLALVENRLRCTRTGLLFNDHVLRELL